MEYTQIDTKELKKVLSTYPLYFLQINGKADFYDGWKLSIQGKTLDDVVFLAEKLQTLLDYTDASYKFGTQKLIDYKHPQQSTKLLTIYIPNSMNVEEYAKLVETELSGYKGAEGIETPQSYIAYNKKLGIHYRNDRTECGEYIPAN